MKVSFITSRKLIVSITITCSLFLLICIIWYFQSEEPCEIFHTCQYLTVKMEKNRDGLFCLNETTSTLQSFHVYNPQTCKEIFRFDVQQIRYMFDDLTYCFNNEPILRNNSRPSIEQNCPIKFQNNSTKICFDSSNMLSSIQFFDKYFLNPQEAYHLYIYLRLFMSSETISTAKSLQIY